MESDTATHKPCGQNPTAPPPGRRCGASAGAGSPSGSVEGIWSVDVDSGRSGVACARDHRGRRRIVRVELPVHCVGGHMDELALTGNDRVVASGTELDSKVPAYDVKAG